MIHNELLTSFSTSAVISFFCIEPFQASVNPIFYIPNSQLSRTTRNFLTLDIGSSLVIADVAAIVKDPGIEIFAFAPGAGGKAFGAGFPPYTPMERETNTPLLRHSRGYACQERLIAPARGSTRRALAEVVFIKTSTRTRCKFLGDKLRPGMSVPEQHCGV